MSRRVVATSLAVVAIMLGAGACGSDESSDEPTIPASEPAISEPVATEPGDEPAVTEPGVTEPGVTEPVATEPAVTPAVTEAPELPSTDAPETTATPPAAGAGTITVTEADVASLEAQLDEIDALLVGIESDLAQD